MLRHLIATLAYRAAKVLRDAPPDFANFSSAETTRRPVLIVAHLADLMAWAASLADGTSVWTAGGSGDWDTEVGRFFDGMRRLDDRLAAGPLAEADEKKLISGPLADALTHVGQLAMLRGLAGAPIRPESYARAEVVVGRVGLDQAAPLQEFKGDASVKR
jgi:hypothetical protein